MYVIVTHHVNWHREYLWLDRENTGNWKMQFEWVPCHMLWFNLFFYKLSEINIPVEICLKHQPFWGLGVNRTE